MSGLYVGVNLGHAGSVVGLRAPIMVWGSVHPGLPHQPGRHPNPRAGIAWDTPQGSGSQVQHIHIRTIFIHHYSRFPNWAEMKGTEIRILRNSKILNLGCIFMI